MANGRTRFEWDVDVVLLGLLQQLRLPIEYVTRVYNAVHPRFDDIATAAGRGGQWPLQMVERRYFTWQSAETILDATTGEFLERIPAPPVESVCYDIAEMARRKGGGGRDAAGAEGRRAEGGVNESSG